MEKYESFKTVLISIGKVWRYNNTGLDQLAGYLRENSYDFDIKYYHRGERETMILEDLPKDYNLYGFSVHSSNYQKCCYICKSIKKLNPKAVIAFGGSFPTLYYKEIMDENKFLDCIILGDGEKPFENLTNHLKKSILETLDDDSIVTKFSNLNKVSFCNSEILHKPIFDYYNQDSLENNSRKVHCIQTKNNICTGRCSFCIERKGKIAYKSIEPIISEIKYVSENYGVRKFFFTDDNILDPDNMFAKERIKNLCYEIKKLNMKLVFECYIKAKSLTDSDYDNNLLKEMRSAGFTTIFVGIESGNNQDLELYNKFTEVKDNYSILNLLNKHEFSTLMGFIYFNPYSTISTLRENYKFLTDIRSTNLFHYIGTFLSIHKYTDIYYKTKKDNLLRSEFDILNNFSYDFVCKEVDKIVSFIRTNISERSSNLEYELDWVYGYYKECIRINQNALKYSDELKSMKQNQFKIMKEFFYYLYFKNDLNMCESLVDEFMKYFEDIQQRLSEIYKDLVALFSQY